jgi:hypothetical protein
MYKIGVMGACWGGNSPFYSAALSPPANAQVKQLLVLPVICNINLIEKGSKGVWDSAMTIAARDELSLKLTIS